MPTLWTNRLPRYLGVSVQHIIAIYTAAVPEQIQTIYTAAVCQHKIIFTRQPFKSQIGYTYCCRLYTKNRYFHGSRSSAKSVIYIAAGYIHRLLFTRQSFKSHLGYIRGLLFKFVDFLYSRSEDFYTALKVKSSENIFVSLSFDV